MACKDTGVIETGNNDVPCECSAGDTALFNVCGEGTLSGTEIKRRNAQPQMPMKYGNRAEFGHEFQWDKKLERWQSTSGKCVIVEPPKLPHEPWFVIVPENDSNEEIYGHEAEVRAFAVAEAYTRQQSGRA